MQKNVSSVGKYPNLYAEMVRSFPLFLCKWKGVDPAILSEIAARFYKFYLCAQTLMKILKLKFTVKFLILLLLLQIRCIYFRSLNESFQKLWKNTELNFPHMLYLFTCLGMHGFDNLFRLFLYQLVLFLDHCWEREMKCGIDDVSKSIFWIGQTLLRIL